MTDPKLLTYLGSSDSGENCLFKREFLDQADVMVFIVNGTLTTAGQLSFDKGFCPYDTGCGCCSASWSPDRNTLIHYWKLTESK